MCSSKSSESKYTLSFVLNFVVHDLFPFVLLQRLEYLFLPFFSTGKFTDVLFKLVFNCFHFFKKLEGDIHVSPNGVAFVKSNIKRGVLPR